MNCATSQGDQTREPITLNGKMNRNRSAAELDDLEFQNRVK